MFIGLIRKDTWHQHTVCTCWNSYHLVEKEDIGMFSTHLAYDIEICFWEMPWFYNAHEPRRYLVKMKTRPLVVSETTINKIGLSFTKHFSFREWELQKFHFLPSMNTIIFPPRECNLPMILKWLKDSLLKICLTRLFLYVLVSFFYKSVLFRVKAVQFCP